MASAPPLPTAPSNVDGAHRRWSKSALRTPGVLAGLRLSGLWLLTGGAARLAGSDVVPSRVFSFLGIGYLHTQPWEYPWLWAMLSLLTTAAVLTSLTWLFTAWLTRNGDRFVSLWFAAVLATTVLGLVIDFRSVIDYLQDFGLRGLTTASIEAAPATAYWGIVWGWLPAVLVRRRLTADEFRTPSTTAAVVTAAISILLAIVIGMFATDAWRAQIARDNAQAQGLSEEDGAFPDPDADGEPVPDVAPGVSEPRLDPDRCTPDTSTLLLGASDAATGHRVQVITLLNFTDEPCVIEGYPDIAFADQNGNELAVAVATGSSFMAQDPGAAAIVVPAQGEAMTTISWDANATAGALVTRQLYAASLPGFPRGSWPVELDVVAGAEVTISAWHLDDTLQSAP